MAFDVNKMRENIEKRDTELAMQQAKPEEPQGPIWTENRIAELHEEAADSTMEETYTFDPEESRPQFEAIGTLVSNTARDMVEAEKEYVLAEQSGDEEAIERARMKSVYAPVKEGAREFMAAYADDNKSSFQSFAQGLRQSSANLEYFMTPEEKIAQARKIEETLNIPAGLLLEDNEAMQNAMSAYDYTQKVLAAGGSMEQVYKDFPKLKEIAGMDPQGAALALKDLHHVREVRDIASAWTAFWKSGDESYEYGLLKAKDAFEGLTDEERKRENELKEAIDNAPVAPSFFVNPAVAMLSGLQSLPEMIYSTAKAVPYGVTGGVIGAAVMGAPTFGAGLPVGAAAGFKKGFDVGMYIEMARPMMGRKFAEYQAMTDESGNRIMTDEDARELAIIETIPEALIELGFFKMGAEKAALGEHAKKVVADAMRGVTRPAASKAAAGGLWGAFKGILETGFSEMAEEFGQAYPSELMENYIKQTAKTGDVSFDASRFADTLAGADWGSITEKAAAAAMEAAPGSFFLGGITAGVGAPIGSVRYGLEYRAWNRQFGEMAKTERTTMTGTVMLEQLQKAVHDSSLQETAPDVQREILRDELKDTPWKMAYVDVEYALKAENGVEDVREAGKAAGMTNEEIEQAIEEKGTIAVPLESYAQSEASSNLLDSVSFSPDAEPLAKIRENAKRAAEAYNKRVTEETKKQIALTEAMTETLFPEEGEERQAATAAIYQNPENPAQGWKELYAAATAELDEILAPALAALDRGRGNGTSVVENEDGTTGRVSNNEEWYQDWYREHGKAPTKEELREMAKRMITGDVTAPKVEGWTPTDKETAEAMANEKNRLAAAEHEIAVLESIKERMQEINGTEIQLTKGLSPEAYKLYREINTSLLGMGGKVGRAARVNALIMARHADVFTQRKQAKGEKFTVQDYMNRLKVVMGGENGAVGGYAQQEMTRQIDEVRSKYEGTDKWMKAPNGEPTKLTEEQWLTVRTDAFKNWFGDWENDAANASKVVDENGEPRVVYHGTSADFDTFSLDYLGAASGDAGFFGKGFYFAFTEGEARMYNGRRIIDAFVNLKNPLYFIEELQTYDGMRANTLGAENVAFVMNIAEKFPELAQDHVIDAWKRTGDGGGEATELSFAEFTKQIKNIIGEKEFKIDEVETSSGEKEYILTADKKEKTYTDSKGKKRKYTEYGFQKRFLYKKDAENKLLQAYYYLSEAVYDGIDIPRAAVVVQETDFNEALKKRGYDGVIQSKDGDEVVAFEPNQIKSATDNNGQFLVDDPNIYHQSAGANIDNLGENGQNKSAATGGAEVVVKGDEFGQYKDIKELRAKAVQYYSKNLQGTSVENKVLGKIDIDENGIVNFTGSGKREMKGTSAKTNKLLLVKYLPQLIAGATNITSSEAEKERHANETFYYLHTSATIDGDNVPVEITLVKRNDGSIQYYNHILPAEENNKNTSVSPGPESSREALGTPAVDVSFGNPNIPRGGGNVNEKPYSVKASESRSDNQGGFSDGQNPETFSQGTKGNTKNFADGTKLVELFANADESTFLHETGHIFLMDLEELAREGDEASIADLAVVDEWATWHDGDAAKYKNTPWAGEFAKREKYIKEAQKNGVAKMPDETTKTLDQLLREWKQERFARAFEIYLYEGKAPSKGLRNVFRKFCDFLKQVYTVLVSDGAGASAQVEAVMGRLMAADEEIEAMEQDERYKDFMQAGGEKLMYEDAAETFSRWHEEAKEEARDKLRKIVMRSLTGKLARRRKEILREERVKKETELSNQPVYLARQAAKETGIKDAWQAYFPNKEAWEKADKAAPTMEEALDAYMQRYEADLDTKDVQDVLKEETIEKAMSSTKSHEKLLRMEQRAFARKAALADRLAGKTRRRIEDVEQWIEKMPDAIDKEDMGPWHKAITSLKLSNRWTKEELDAIDRLSVSASKEQAKHNFETLRKIMKERKVGLADLRETNRGRVDALRKQARATIARQKLAQATQVYTHRKEEREAAKEAEALAKKERWAEAAQAKERELLASFMASEAEKVRNRQDAILKRIRAQLNARTKLPKDERYWHQHIAYLLRVTDKDAAKPDGLASLSDIARMLGDGLDVATDEEGRSNILDLMEKLADGNNYKDGYHGMKLEEFEDAADVLQVLYTTGKDKFNLKLTQGKTIEEAREEILNDPTAYNGARVRQSTVTGNPNRGGVFWSETMSRIPGVGDALSEYAQRYGLSMTKPEGLINLLGQKAHKYIYDAYDRAAEQEAAMTAEFMGRMEEILKKRFTPDEMREWKTRAYTWDGQAVSKENILAMALNLGNDINMDRLVTGLNAVESNLQGFIAEHMTEKDWLFCQDVWDLLQTYWPETVRVEMELNGTRLKPQEAREFNVKTKDKNGNEKEIHMRGGYYPIKYDPKLSTKSKETAENEALKGAMSGATVLGMGRGFTKDRAAKGAVKDRPLLLSLSVIPDHVNEAVHNITTRLAARDVYRLINDREFKNYVTSTLGMDAYGVLQRWATDVWKIKPTESNGAEEVVNNIIRPIRQNSGIAIMGYRMWPTTENATNIFPMMDALGAAETVTAMQDYYANKKEFDELIAKSLFMRERTERMDRDMRGQRDMFERHNAVSEWLVKHAYDPITFTDLLTSKPLWARAYKNAFPKMLEAVRKENEENAATYESRRAECEKINATIIDMRKRRQAMQDELRRRQYRQAPKAETEFTRMSSQTLRDEIHIIDGEIEEKGKALFIMGEKTERASKLVIRTEQETLKEAEHRAVLEADRAVREVIGSGDVKDMSEVQRSRNEAVKALTMFYSYFNTQANAIIQAHWKGKWQGGPGYDFTPVAKAIAYRFLLTAALSTAMRWMFFGEGDDDKDKYKKDKEGNKIEVPVLERVLKQYAKNALSTTVGGLYGLREVGNWAINFFIDGTVYGGGARFDGMYGSLVNQVLKEGELILKKRERDEKAREDEEKRQERYRNATPTQRRRMRQDEQYRKPPNTISYADILRGAGEIGTRFTAGRFGVTDPIADAVLGTMQYIFDSDGRYDATLGNMMWSAFWTKKPVKRKPPEKPAKDKKKGR